MRFRLEPKRTMITRSFLIFAPAMLLACCNTVAVKQIAGDALPEGIEGRRFEGKWRGADGVTAVFRVKDKASGIVEVKTREADGHTDTTELALRLLGDKLVATAVDHGLVNADKPGMFFRVALAEEHLAVFLPKFDLLKDAVKNGQIAGRIQEDKFMSGPDGAQTAHKSESAVLDKFGIVEAGKLGGVFACFEPDPSLVFVREAAPPPKPVKKHPAR